MLILAFVAAALIAGIDQLIKLWIVGNFELYEDRPFLQIGSLDILHLHYMLSKVIATLLVLFWNYIARKKLLYR